MIREPEAESDEERMPGVPVGRRKSNRSDNVDRKVSQWSTIDPRETQLVFPLEWSELRKRVARVVTNPYFDIVIGVLVLINIGMLVHQTNRHGLGLDSEPIVTWANFGMLVVYTLEACLRLYAFRKAYFCSAWNLLDFFVLISDWFLQILAFALDAEVPRAALLRTLRVVRALRVLRTIRTLHLFRELYIMLYGFFSALKAIAWAAVLLLLMLLIWGIVAVEMIHPLNQEIALTGIYHDCERCPRAFQTVWASVLTFSQQIVAGDSWGKVTIPIMEEHPLVVPFFLMVFVTIDLGLLNLILSVIVDKAHQAHQEDKKFQISQRQAAFDAAKQSLMDLCAELDEDHSGCLSLAELLNGYDRLPEFQEQMRLMDVERDDMLSLFKVLDEDGSGDIEYSEFVEQVVKMRSQDMSLSLMFLRSQIKEVKQQTHMISDALETLKAHLEDSGMNLKNISFKKSASASEYGMLEGSRSLGVNSISPAYRNGGIHGTNGFPGLTNGLNGSTTTTDSLPKRLPSFSTVATQTETSPDSLPPELASWQAQVRDLRTALLQLEGSMASVSEVQRPERVLWQGNSVSATARPKQEFINSCCAPARKSAEQIASPRSKWARSTQMPPIQAKQASDTRPS
ncbi:unnamed protein product [Effrenium voratum]|uniref:EF-hand domain-containing protein n=1 Tax=Effrenium voratum TaxID=2562239 RepID=A0AA36JG26_9DINO|nr:unnamed protein product [Effrenium voratum]CAJ1415557.1 unnamed protein product [Effrenium voratum]